MHFWNEIIGFRTFWGSALFASAAIFFLLIFKTTEKFMSNRTVFQMSDKEFPISKIPFPAVTICSESLIYRIIPNIGNISKSLTDDK